MVMGDISIKIICHDHPDFNQINDSDLLLVQTISISEFFYGGCLTIKHLDGTTFTQKFTRCIHKTPIFCLKNKGLPKLSQTGKNTSDPNYDYIKISPQEKVERGDLYIYLTIDGINSKCNDHLSKEYTKTVENILKKIFPPSNY